MSQVYYLLLQVSLCGFRGFSYQSREVAEIGNVQITAQQIKWLLLACHGGIAIVAGIILVVIGSRT